MTTEDVTPHYKVVVDREDNPDVLTIKVDAGRGDESFTNEVSGLQDIECHIHQNIN